MGGPHAKLSSAHGSPAVAGTQTQAYVISRSLSLRGATTKQRCGVGKNTDKLIFGVENHLHLTKTALRNYSEDVRIALKDKEFDTGVSMGALLKRIATEDPARAAKIKADADRLWKENSGLVLGCVKETKKALSTLADYVAKKKAARKLPWNSKATKKADAFIKETNKFLDGIPTKMASLKEDMTKVAADIEAVSKQFGKYGLLAADLKKETKDQSDD
jgi:hypothetical protein